MRVKPRLLQCVLLLLAAVLLWKAAYIHAKAQLAQLLLESAWRHTLEQKQAYKPWPWADVYPVARLVVAREKVDYIVLNSHAGEALAFGPGAEIYHDARSGSDSWVIGGHRDTHFRFLKDVSVGDEIFLYTVNGSALNYRIVATQIADSRTQQLQVSGEQASLLLVTCYPFDTLEVGGPLRYVVTASLLKQQD